MERTWLPEARTSHLNSGSILATNPSLAEPQSQHLEDGHKAAAPHGVTVTVEEEGSHIPFHNAENHIGSYDCPVPSSHHQLSEMVPRRPSWTSHSFLPATHSIFPPLILFQDRNEGKWGKRVYYPLNRSHWVAIVSALSMNRNQITFLIWGEAMRTLVCEAGSLHGRTPCLRGRDQLPPSIVKSRKFWSRSSHPEPSSATQGQCQQN